MRVITGSARGRKLIAPAGMAVRPTSDMVKEAVFSIIQFEIEGAVVLDLFAGSGQLGIEALSRGASKAVFVDTSRESIDAVKANLTTAGFFKSSQVVTMDAFSFLSGTQQTFDIAFLDPPYGQELLEKALPLLAPKMSDGGILICETDRRELLPETVEGFPKKKEYRYGKSKITVYRREEMQ